MSDPLLPGSRAGLRRRGGSVRRGTVAAIAAALQVAACAEYLGTSFSEIAPPELGGQSAQPAARCLLEAVNNAPPGAPWQISRAHRVHLRGWAIDAASMSNSDWLAIQLTAAGGGKRYYAVTWRRGNRDDVARVIGPGPGIARAGFELAGTVQLLPPGAYDIDLVLRAPSGLVSCPTGRQLVVN
jgi:hypothetical protein